MAKRAWVVHPDTEERGVGPDGKAVAIRAVSLQALASAAIEGVTLVHRAGGVLTVQAHRVETGYPNERVTAVAMVEWKDRTDARPQPEDEGADIAPPVQSDEYDVQDALADEALDGASVPALQGA